MEVDLTYFHINVPGAKHAKISGELTEEDIRDMKPVITDEEREARLQAHADTVVEHGILYFS